MDMTSQLWAERILAEEADRLSDVKRHWDYYRGKHKPAFRVVPGKTNDNITINLCKEIVNAGVDFLFGQEVRFELQEGGEPTPEEEWLETMWQLNRKMTFLQSIALTGGVTGHVFIKIVPDYYEHGGRRYPRLINLDASVVRKVTEPEDVETVRRYIIEYAAIDPDSSEPMYIKQVIERVGEPPAWQIRDYRARGNRQYRLVGQVAWPFSWPPIIDCKNLPNPGEPYGISDLDDDALQDAINLVASRINRILRYHAKPVTWGRGFRAGTLDLSEEGILVIPSERGEIRNLEMSSDLASSREFCRDLMQAFHEISRVPWLDPLKINVGALSGFALRILYRPLLSKTTTKRRLYGDMLVELMRRLLEMAGFGPDHWPTIHWPDPLPVNALEQAQVLEKDMDMGLVSRQTARTMRGYDHEVEQQRIAAEGIEEATFGERMARLFAAGAGAEGGRLGGGRE